jgi:GTPase SAR1 family protein
MTSFNEQFDQHGVWRREFALHLKLLAQWLQDQDLLDAAVQERLSKLERQVRVDKVMVAFVAEFSRGKSELINAIFFADYGRRIMPASAGRTTMCPTEMAYDTDVPPCLRLLPIETRLQPQALMEWRMVPEKWERIDLDVNNSKQLARALAKVAETIRVSLDQAKALGFWNDAALEPPPLMDSQGQVEIPKWRHALINIAHPLLKQGLVILDTPGLNAIGAEPELTVNLIAQAQAVVFMLSADTGVTQSDLAIWREHLVDDGQDRRTRLVVLNKIDTLWDALDNEEDVQSQIDRQVTSTANILGISSKQVVAISAQKGLLAKVNHDAALLKRSCLSTLEEALSQHIMGQRKRILSDAVLKGIADVRVEIHRQIQLRLRELNDQILELHGLQGKNTPVIKHMRLRIHKEQEDFEAGGLKIHAVRSIHMKLLREIFSLLSTTRLKSEMAQLTLALQQRGLKRGIKQIYSQTIERLRANLRVVKAKEMEISAMLEASFLQLNTDYGFSLQLPDAPSLDACLYDLDLIERSHVQYLGLGNAFRLAQSEFVDRLVRALSTRLLSVYESALGEIETWSKSAASQLDTQLRERRKNFLRRIEAIDRIGEASHGLDERTSDIQSKLVSMTQTQAKLEELTEQLRLMITPTHFEHMTDEATTVQSGL